MRRRIEYEAHPGRAGTGHIRRAAHGFEATREAAMAAFAKSWRRGVALCRLSPHKARIAVTLALAQLPRYLARYVLRDFEMLAHGSPHVMSGRTVQIQRVLTWLEGRSRWSKLRVLGQSNLVKLSVLMPAFGYVLLLNENVHQYLTIKYDGWLLHYLPSTWRIWLLFYGSFFLASGSILFNRCPTEVKQYASAFQMVDAERAHRTAQNQTEQLVKEVKALYANMSKWENSIFILPRLRPDQANMGVGSSPDLASSDQWGLALIHIWTVNDIKYPAWRIAVFVLFGAGLILLAVPAGLTFLQVTFLAVIQLFM
jgi:hypothetical protein